MLGVALGIVLLNYKRPEQRFEKKNYEKLVYYQKKIDSLDNVVNDKYSELPYKLQCAEEIVSCYTELKSFCFQSASGRTWYCSSCERPEANAREAVSDLKKELAVLEERREELIQAFHREGWQRYWEDSTHSLAGQGARITRSYEEQITVEAYNPAARLALIRGASGNRYLTNPGFCTCPDYKKREWPCKHIYCLCRLTASPDFSAPLKIPGWGLYGVTACIAGRFNFGTQEAVRAVLQRHHAAVALSIEPAHFILEGQKSVTERAIQRAATLGLMQINEDELFPMLDVDLNADAAPVS